jgi:hypothetical protein
MQITSVAVNSINVKIKLIASRDPTSHSACFGTEGILLVSSAFQETQLIFNTVSGVLNINLIISAISGGRLRGACV